MDREEKLRAAKEKLKKFQKKNRHGGGESGENSVHETEQNESLSSRSTPKFDAAKEGTSSVFTPEARKPLINDQEPLIAQIDDHRSLTSSSVSDQIDQVLAASSTRRISDVTSDDLEVTKMRNVQLEREKNELALLNQQLKDRVTKLEAEIASAVSIAI